jgi:hypothetical protein
MRNAVATKVDFKQTEEVSNSLGNTVEVEAKRKLTHKEKLAREMHRRMRCVSDPAGKSEDEDNEKASLQHCTALHHRDHKHRHHHRHLYYKGKTRGRPSMHHGTRGTGRSSGSKRSEKSADGKSTRQRVAGRGVCYS